MEKLVITVMATRVVGLFPAPSKQVTIEGNESGIFIKGKEFIMDASFSSFIMLIRKVGIITNYTTFYKVHNQPDLSIENLEQQLLPYTRS